MKSLECIVFDVEHGFCAFVKSPNNYGLLIDCGSKEYFSPIKWIRQNYNIGSGNIQYFERRRIAAFYLTHLHLDHFDDIGSLTDVEKPKRFVRDKKVLPFLDKKIAKEDNDSKKEIFKKLKSFSADYDQDPTKDIHWGFDFFDYNQISLSDAKDISLDDDKIINNRSYIIGIEYAGKKIIFPGDIEVKGWEKSFYYPSIKKILKNTNFFITSHHGHKSGFTSNILQYTGIPDIYIVSARSKDESIDSSYSKDEYSNGFIVEGDIKESKMISTRDRNGSIKIEIFDNGYSQISIINTLDNLNENQKKLLHRRSKKIIKNWSLGNAR